MNGATIYMGIVWILGIFSVATLVGWYVLPWIARTWDTIEETEAVADAVAADDFDGHTAQAISVANTAKPISAETAAWLAHIEMCTLDAEWAAKDGVL